MEKTEIAKRAGLAVMAALILYSIIFKDNKIDYVNSGCYINNSGHKIYVTNDMIYLSNIMSQKITFSRDKEGVFFTLEASGIDLNYVLGFSGPARFKHRFSENMRRINLMENQGNGMVFSLVNSPEDVEACMEWGIR
jgi:hypothetical protein